MKRYIIYSIGSLLVLLTACKITKMDPEIEPGEIKISVQADKTKATSKDGFVANSQIGIYTSVEGTEQRITAFHNNNLGYKCSITSNFWEPLSETLWFQPYQKMTLFSYHPFTGQLGTTMSQIDGDEQNLSFHLKTQQNADNDLQMNDLMYAQYAGISHDNNVAYLNFQHKLTKLTFNIVKGANWLIPEVILSNLRLIGNNLSTSATLNITDGTLTPITPTVEQQIQWTANAFSPALKLSQNAQKVELIVIPGVAQNTTIKFLVNGVEMTYVLKQAQFDPAKNYTYNVNIENLPQESIPLTAEILDWNVVHDIIIIPN